MAENAQTPKSKRDTFRESYAKRHPDVNMDDEEAMYGRLGEDYDNFDKQIGELTESNNKYKKDQDDFLKLLNSNPNNGRYLEGMAQGHDPIYTLVQEHGYDGALEYLSSPEAREYYADADNKHAQQMEQSKKLQADIEKNSAETDKLIAEAIKKGEFTEDDFNEAVSGLLDVSDGLTLGVCKPEWISMWLKAKNRDADVEKAREDGMLEGRNEGLEQNIGKRKSVAAQQSDKPSMPVGVSGKGATNRGKGGSLADMLMGR